MIRVIALGIALSLASSNAEAQGSVWLFITGDSLATYCRDFLLVRRNAAASNDQQLQRYAVMSRVCQMLSRSKVFGITVCRSGLMREISPGSLQNI
jgi:hypothetical protein